MLVNIQAVQVPALWKIIQFAAVKSDNVKEEHIGVYCLTLLQELLAGKKTCYAIQDDAKNISVIVILEFRFDILRDMKYIYFSNLYSFAKQDDTLWKTVLDDLKEIALQNDCKAIIGESSNDRVDSLNSMVGAQCIMKKYVYYL